MPIPTSFRFPDGTLDRIRALAGPGESLTRVILRSLTALEAQPPATLPEPLGDRVAALETRLEELERLIANGVNRVPSSPRRASVAKAVANPHTTRSDAVAKTERAYPPEVRQMALRLREEGRTHAEIIAAIAAVCGRAPSESNVGRTLKTWGRLVL